MKKILVTGGAGFIGSRLVRLLFNQTEFPIIVVDKLTYAGNPNSISEFLDSDRVTFSQTDICDAKPLNEIFTSHQPTHVMHLAAESHVDRSITGAAPFIQTNVIGTFNLLEAARTTWSKMAEPKPNASNMPAEPTGNKFIHVSTDEVYGSLEIGDTQFTEASPYAPNSPYAASKASSDHLVRAWHTTYGLPVIVTNCSNNYGPGQHSEKLIPTVIRTALAGEPIPVYGDGQNIRDWLHVDDHCRALHAVLESGQPGETYNIGSDNEIANIDLVQRICRRLDDTRPRVDGESYESQITFGQRQAWPRSPLRCQLRQNKNKAGLAPPCELCRWSGTDSPTCVMPFLTLAPSITQISDSNAILG